MIAEIKAGSIPGEVSFISVKDFEERYTRSFRNRKIFTSEEAVWWAKHGRIGSRWQIDELMYVKVNDKEDPFKYYTPPVPIDNRGSKAWAQKSCDGSCRSDGCNC